MSTMIYLNGTLVPVARAQISIRDRGFLYGDGLFETLCTRKRVPLFLDDHLDRLEKGLKALSIQNVNLEKLSRAVEQVIEANPFVELTLRIAVSRGIGQRGPSPAVGNEPTCIIDAYPCKPDSDHLKPLSLCLSTCLGAFMPEHKTANYLRSVMARLEAQERGCDEALLIAPDGSLTETAASNIFLIQGRKLLTPGLSCLPGITRDKILALAPDCGFELCTDQLGVEALHDAEEIFLTNSVMGLVPVASVEGRVLAPGQRWKELRRSYDELCRQYIARFL